MARTTNGRRRILPFRVPIFRVFYSLTYTTLYLLMLVFLAISPVTMIYSSLDQSAFQYTFMIGGVVFLTGAMAVLIYSSRLYTNRRVLSDIGKPYVPIEDGEVGKIVRKMIVKQLDRSAVVAWESRPRDLYGEILWAGRQGMLPQEHEKVAVDEYTVGSEIPIDPARPPWGDIQHPGWSSPSHHDANRNPDVQFADVIAELPNLIEARAVSLAPTDPTMTPVPGEPRATDAAVVDILSRPKNMALRDYLTQLGYLGLAQPAELRQRFISQYEKARFGFYPVSVDDFNTLMSTFAELLAGMTALDNEIVKEIRAQTSDQNSMLNVPMPFLRHHDLPESPTKLSPRAYSPESSLISPVTAREGMTPRARTPYLSGSAGSRASLESVIRHAPSDLDTPTRGTHNRESFYAMQVPSSSNFSSDTGSVLVHDADSAG